MDRFGRLERSVFADLPMDPDADADDRACDARAAHAGGAIVGPSRRAGPAHGSTGSPSAGNRNQ